MRARKHDLKVYIGGLITGMVILLTATAFADSVEKTVNVWFGAVKLVVGGVPAENETMLYEGRTYVQLREAAELLGMEVYWDGDSGTAYIDWPGMAEQYKKPEIDINVDLSYRDIDDKKLKEMVEKGGVPSNVTSLFLNGNSISDLTPLSKFTEIRTLGLQDNKITDVKPLAALGNCMYLYISGNSIKDIKPFESMKSLLYLSVDCGTMTRQQADALNKILPNCGIELIPVSVKMSYEGMTDKRLAELVANGEIPDYTNVLLLSGNQISNITPLKSLANLTDLYIDSNVIKDLTPLSEMTGLKLLNIDNNKFSDLKPLSSMKNLNSLSLMGNEISDITPLGSMTGLVNLLLDDIKTGDLTPIKSLTNLENLSIGGSKINDLSALKSLTKLTSLSLMNVAISDITQLKTFTGLQFLYISSINLTKAQINELQEALPNCYVSSDWIEPYYQPYFAVYY